MNALRSNLLLVALLLVPMSVAANSEPLPEEVLILAEYAGVTEDQLRNAYPALVVHRDALLQEFDQLQEPRILKYKHRKRLKKHSVLLRKQLKSDMNGRQARRLQQLVTAVLVSTHTESTSDLSAFRRQRHGATARSGWANDDGRALGSPLSSSTWTDTHVQNADGSWSNPEYYPRQ